MLTEHARDQASSYEKQQPGNKGGYLNIPVVCGGFVAGARKRGEVTGCGILDGVPEKKPEVFAPQRLKREQETSPKRFMSQRVPRLALLVTYNVQTDTLAPPIL